MSVFSASSLPQSVYATLWLRRRLIQRTHCVGGNVLLEAVAEFADEAVEAVLKSPHLR